MALHRFDSTYKHRYIIVLISWGQFNASDFMIYIFYLLSIQTAVCICRLPCRFTHVFFVCVSLPRFLYTALISINRTLDYAKCMLRFDDSLILNHDENSQKERKQISLLSIQKKFGNPQVKWNGCGCVCV